MLVAIVAFAGGAASVHPEMIENLYESIYPSDSAKRQALDLCFLQDHKFNRLDPEEREGCYRRNIAPAVGRSAMAGTMAPPIEPNAVDLWRAAGEGHMPRNDIRRSEQTLNALRIAH